MKWCLVFTLFFAVGHCGMTKRHDSEEKDDVFRCYFFGDETELSWDNVCDDVKDCEYGEDEEIWACAKKNNEFVCWGDGPDDEPYTIPMNKTCNGVNDCRVHRWSQFNVSSDENKHLCHDNKTEFVCNEATVIPLDKKCDGINDCPASPWAREGDKTRDEELWTCKPEGGVICWEDQTYVNKSQVCDGVMDCTVPEGRIKSEDELYYHCSEEKLEGLFICWGGEKAIDEGLKCNGHDDCGTETYGNFASDESAYECAQPDEMVCNATMTVKKSARCDGINDCPGDDEDQWMCEHRKSMNLAMNHNFTCHDSDKTYTLDQMCDGVFDCPGQDESKWICDKLRDSDSGEDEEDDINIIMAARNEMKERDLNKYLERRGIDRRSVDRF